VLSHSRFPIVALVTIFATLVLAGNALAYVGPGAGMEFITYAISLLAMVGLAFFSIIMWPFYTFLRWLKGGKKAATMEQPSVAPPPAADAANPALPAATATETPTTPSTP
jgi:hypothetical protein